MQTSSYVAYRNQQQLKLIYRSRAIGSDVTYGVVGDVSDGAHVLSDQRAE